MAVPVTDSECTSAVCVCVCVCVCVSLSVCVCLSVCAEGRVYPQLGRVSLSDSKGDPEPSQHKAGPRQATAGSLVSGGGSEADCEGGGIL